MPTTRSYPSPKGRHRLSVKEKHKQNARTQDWEEEERSERVIKKAL